MCWQKNSTKRKISNKIKWKSREASVKTQAQNEKIFFKNTPNMPSAANWNSKSGIKYGGKAIHKTEICKKQTNFNKNKPKNKQPQVFKKNATPQKYKPKIAGNPQGWQHCSVSKLGSRAAGNIALQRGADCKIFQSESSPDLIKLNPIQPWSANFLKIITPIQPWSANVKSFIIILPHEAKELLELFCL